MPRKSLERLIGLFNLAKKREIERYCKDLVITSEDFADILIAGHIAGLGPYQYACHFREITPEELNPKDNEFAALGKNDIGPLKGHALKAMRKVDQLFRNRRLLAVHLFYVQSKKYWHMFYFDQRDYQASQIHWKHGPHIHYCHDSFTREPLRRIERSSGYPRHV